VPELFPAVNIRQVNFNGRNPDSAYRVMYCYTGVRVSRRIYYYYVEFSACFSDDFDYFAFVVRLEKFDTDFKAFAFFVIAALIDFKSALP
jgi:hypothetical protein